MATWRCEKCGWDNAEKWDKCAKCGYPQMGTKEEIEAWMHEKAQANAQAVAVQQAQQGVVDLAYVTRTIGNFGQAQIDLLKSINGKLSFIVWVIIIGIILQILLGLRIL
jgi:ribosomal protein L37E